LASLVQAFLLGSFFSGKVNFLQSLFSAKALSSSRLWRFGKSVSVSKIKSGLKKIMARVKSSQLKAWFCFWQKGLAQPAHT